jgi:outer membrane protein assembly factor BamB
MHKSITSIRRASRRIGWLPVVCFLLVAVTQAQTPSWPQWGGPRRDFTVEVKGLAETWPAAGPKRLWSRPLGEGHSSVVVEGDRLYTMYSKGDQEFIIAMEAATGKTIWEKGNAASAEGMDLQFGRGPHSTPLLVGNQLFSVGLRGNLQALEKETGKAIWSHDLWKEYQGQFNDRGYACSPMAYKNMVIVTVGGPGQALMAFDQKTGRIVWKQQDFGISPSTPMLIKVDGQEQLVIALADQVVGLDPNTGELLWKHQHKCDWGLNITPPIWGPDNILFISSAYSGGSRAIQLQQAGGKTTVKELWANKRMRLHHTTMLRLGDLVYGSSGDFGPAPMTAVNVKTGEIVWQDRSFPKVNFVYADGKIILLDEDGHLALATLSPQGMKVLSKAPLLEHLAWTPPTLAGTKLYVRDRKLITALDLK